MLSTEEGRAWATQIPAEELTSPMADLAATAYSYPESYIQNELDTVARHNIIMDFCR